MPSAGSSAPGESPSLSPADLGAVPPALPRPRWQPGKAGQAARSWGEQPGQAARARREQPGQAARPGREQPGQAARAGREQPGQAARARLTGKTSQPRPYRVCMVCLGNICRSPMAEVILRDELDQAGLAARVVVDSAGTGDWHIGQPMDRRAARELARHGLDGSRHRARQFVPSCFDLYDLIIGMDSANLHDLHAMAPDADAASRVVLLRAFDPALAGHREPGELEVPDPYYERDDYGPVYDLIWPAARGLAGRLAALLDGTRQ